MKSIDFVNEKYLSNTIDAVVASVVMNRIDGAARSNPMEEHGVSDDFRLCASVECKTLFGCAFALVSIASRRRSRIIIIIIVR